MPAPATVTTDGGITLRLEGKVPMSVYRRLQEADQSFNYDEVYQILAMYVKEWSFSDLDPSDPASYDELDTTEYIDIVQAVSQWMAGRYRGKN